MICPNCGSENKDDVNQCTFCGQRLAPKNGSGAENAYDRSNQTNGNQNFNGQPNQNQYQNSYQDPNQYQNPYQNQSSYGQPPYQNQQKASNGLAITSMVLALVSIILSCFIPYLSVPMDIAAIILGIFSLVKCKNASKGMAITGIVVGAIMLIFGVLIIVMAVYLVSSGAYSEMFSDPAFQEYFNNLMNSDLLIQLRNFF